MLDAMTGLLKEAALEPIFIDMSHGFRRGRGAKTFFRAVVFWPEMDYLIQVDVKSFDRIPHDRLLSLLLHHFGEENYPFLDLVDRFIKADILDRFGVPQILYGPERPREL